MCGIVGIVAKQPVNQDLYDSLTVLQHRGQDAAGIITIDQQNSFRLRKANGLVRDIFEQKHMHRLQGHIGFGHVRYPTAGSSSSAEAQPLYVNSPFGISLAHNGNLTNAEAISHWLFTEARRHINTGSDSEILLNTFAYELQQYTTRSLTEKDIFDAITRVHRRIRGGYAVIALVIDHGLIAFRDPYGIRPLVLGKRETEKGTEYSVASESVALSSTGFQLVRDVAPGEALYITNDGVLHSYQCAENPILAPCVFEYVYFARPDSMIDNISVYRSRVEMGVRLGQHIKSTWDEGETEIDVVIPVPETSCDTALSIAHELNLPYRQGFVKNRYIARTFIMPGQKAREHSIRRKLNPIHSEFKGKNVLLVDDSIVRGTTSEQIIAMAREAGAKKVYFASAAPEIRFPNVYGIDLASVNELIAHGRDIDEIAQQIGADKLIYQKQSDLISALQQCNPEIKQFETSVFDGNYITGDIDQDYLNHLDSRRNKNRANNQEMMASHLEIYNLGK